MGYSICYYNFHSVYGPLGDLFYELYPISTCVRPSVALNFTEAYHIEKVHHWPGLDDSFGKEFVALIAGSLTIPTSGSYEFLLEGTNSIEMRVDGNTTFTLGYTGSSMNSANATLELTAGPHRIEIYYVFTDLFAKLALSWRAQGGEWRLLDPSTLHFGRCFIPG